MRLFFILICTQNVAVGVLDSDSSEEDEPTTDLKLEPKRRNQAMESVKKIVERVQCFTVLLAILFSANPAPTPFTNRKVCKITN